MVDKICWYFYDLMFLVSLVNQSDRVSGTSDYLLNVIPGFMCFFPELLQGEQNSREASE